MKQWMKRLSMALAAAPLLLATTQVTQAATTPSQPDHMEHRLAACAQCHGEHGQGLEDKPGIPHLAGKPAGYLYQQLQSFRSGRRDNPAMQYVVRQLSPEYLKQIALHYASQPLVYEPEVPEGITKEQLERGKQLVHHGDGHSVPSCQRCHGERLTGVKPMIPGIVGQSYKYLLAQFKHWRHDDRSSSGTHCMWVVANRMTDADIKAVSAWLASQPLPADTSLSELSDLPQELPGWCEIETVKVTP